MAKRLGTDSVLPALIVLAVAFFIGSLIGWILAGSVAGLGNQSLASYLEGYVSATQSGVVTTPILPGLIWEHFRWPLLAVALGFTALGLVGLPLLFLARGFLLSFAVCSFARMFGGSGCIFAFVLFGLSGLVSIPALFLLGVKGWDVSRGLAAHLRGEGRRIHWPNRQYLIRSGLCLSLFCVCILLEYFVAPPLLTAVANLLIP